MNKFKSAESTLQAVHPDFRLDDFGEYLAGYFLTLPRKFGESNQKYGRRKAVTVTRAKREIEKKHGYIRYHEWRGDQLQLECGIDC